MEGRGGGGGLSPWSGDFGEPAPPKHNLGASPLNSLNLSSKISGRADRRPHQGSFLVERLSRLSCLVQITLSLNRTRRADTRGSNTARAEARRATSGAAVHASSSCKQRAAAFGVSIGVF